MKTITVTVHKSSIELKAGETVHDFIRDLGGESKVHILDSLNLPEDSSGAYVDEVFGDYIVVNVWQSGVEDKYYAFTYKRNVEGNGYEFGEPVEVERKTIFVQTNPAAVVKNLCGDWVKKSLWSGVL